MSFDIYAAKRFEDDECWGPVIDFKNWEQTILAKNADELSDEGLDPFIPNPDFTPDAGMNMANHNAELLFEILGFKRDLNESFYLLEIEKVHEAAMRTLASAKSAFSSPDRTEKGSAGATFHIGGIPDGYIEEKLRKLLAIIVKGRPLGATHILAG